MTKTDPFFRRGHDDKSALIVGNHLAVRRTADGWRMYGLARNLRYALKLSDEFLPASFEEFS